MTHSYSKKQRRLSYILRFLTFKSQFWRVKTVERSNHERQKLSFFSSRNFQRQKHVLMLKALLFHCFHVLKAKTELGKTKNTREMTSEF